MHTSYDQKPSRPESSDEAVGVGGALVIAAVLALFGWFAGRQVYVYFAVADGVEELMETRGLSEEAAARAFHRMYRVNDQSDLCFTAMSIGAMTFGGISFLIMLVAIKRREQREHRQLRCLTMGGDRKLQFSNSTQSEDRTETAEPIEWQVQDSPPQLKTEDPVERQNIDVKGEGDGRAPAR
jgi:hypothetical protein